MEAVVAELPSSLRAFVAGQIESGVYESVLQLLTDAARQLEEDAELEGLREFRLRRKIEHSFAQLDRGEFEEVADVGAWMDNLRRKSGAA